MVAIRAAEVDRAVARRAAEIGLLLFYGPDAGRVAERARRAAEAAVADPSDPFQLVRLDGDTLAEAPARLAEEVSTYGLFGERRAVWVRATSRNIAGAVTASLTRLNPETLVVVEAGDLARTSPLRQACEASPLALALPCFADEHRDLATVVDDAMKEAGLAIDADAREFLFGSLGGDRLATRGELAKLALYAHGQPRVSLEDVMAAVSDVSRLSLDALLDAAFLQDRGEVESRLAQVQATGMAPAAVLSATQRHALQLLACRARIDDGEDVDGALRSWRGLYGPRQTNARRQLGRWTTGTLVRVVRIIQEGTLRTRTLPGLAGPVTDEVLLTIARGGGSQPPARRSERQTESS